MGRTTHTDRKSTAVKTIVKHNPDGSVATKIAPKKPQVEKKKPKKANTPLTEWRLRNKLDKKESCIPLAPFERLVRDIASNYREDLRFQKNAIVALREAAEMYLINIFTGSQMMAYHEKERLTIRIKDMKLFLKTQNMTPCNNFGRNEFELQKHAKKLGWNEKIQIKNPYQVKKLETEISSSKKKETESPSVADDQPPALTSVSEKDPQSIDDLF